MSKLQITNYRQSAFSIIMTLIMVVGFLLTTVQTGGAAKITRIVVMPFTVNAGKDLSFLQRGIVDMLVSRLGQENKVIAITAGLPGDDPSSLAQRTKADYVVFGSFTALGNRISTDALVVNGVDVDNPVLSFGRTGRQQDEVIDHIDALAAMINERLFDRSSGQPSQTEVAAKKMPQMRVLDPKKDTAWIGPTSSIPGGEQAIISPENVAAPDSTHIQGLGDFEGQLNGLAVGDVDGDGTVEMVTVTANYLYVHSLQKGHWTQLAEYKDSGAFVGVDVADVNGNGRQEIFVTNFNDTDSWVNSFVLEWDGKTLQRVAEELPWYFRTVDISPRGKVLLGQRQTAGERFGKGIFEMVWQAGAYAPGNRLPLPDNLNIFGFAYGAVRSADTLEVVSHNSKGYIQILKQSGEVVWGSTNRYGGGKNAIKFTDDLQWDLKENVYLSPRVHLHDLDGDGVQEILVINNRANSDSRIVVHRFYAKGCLEWLKWMDGGFRSNMRTLDMNLFIADSALVDVDGDGELEIVAAVVKKESGLMGKGASYLAVLGATP